jgi:hypothetical protein
MFNKKVYLAKSNLASGLDFEYVKSNLLRIPDIEIIEYGDGIEPFECACFVYIPNSAVPFDNVIPVNKNSFLAMDSFIKGFEGGKGLPLFTYIGRDDAWDDEDVEDSLPMGNPFEELFEADKDSWEGYGQLVINTEENESLLHVINSLLTGSARNTWRHNTRHYMPEPKFRIPPIPTFEERRSKGTKRPTSSSLNTDVLVRNSQRNIRVDKQSYTNKAKQNLEERELLLSRLEHKKSVSKGDDDDIDVSPSRVRHTNIKSERRKR